MFKGRARVKEYSLRERTEGMIHTVTATVSKLLQSVQRLKYATSQTSLYIKRTYMNKLTFCPSMENS